MTMGGGGIHAWFSKKKRQSEQAEITGN